MSAVALVRAVKLNILQEQDGKHISDCYFHIRTQITYLRDSVLSSRNCFIVLLPEDEGRGHAHHPTFQPDWSSFRNTHVLQLLKELGRVFHLFLCSGNDLD